MRTSHRPAVELLESRRLMDATAALSEGILTVTGTDRKDSIVFTLDSADPTQLVVQLGREKTLYDLADVSEVVVNAGDGNDRILVLEKAGPIFVPFKIDAGAGNDLIQTGSGNDVIVAGDGVDRVDGGAGDDQIDGGEGNDKLVGGADNDLILAGAGKDKLSGGAGDDNLDGGDGRDAIATGAGADAVAVDDSNASEVKERAINRADDGEYHVTELSSLSSDLQALHESIVPGSHVSRVEVKDNFVTMYYRFDGDAQVYKTVVDVTDGTVNLVSREISPREIREVARGAFASQNGGAEVLAIFQHSHGLFDIRYRDADGSIKETQAENYAFTLDDAANDINNDGLFNDNNGDQDNKDPNNNGHDFHEGNGGNGGNDGVAPDGNQDGQPTPDGNAGNDGMMPNV